MSIEVVRVELNKIMDKITGVRWIRIIHDDGLTCPHYDINSDEVAQDPDILRNEDAYAPIAAANLSLSEHIASVAKLGKPRFTIISGEDATYFFLPIGTTSQWYISFAVDGYPSVDKVLAYFEQNHYLQDIEPLLKRYQY